MDDATTTNGKFPPCAGCGLRVAHKLCIAWGTPVYMDSVHPDWGDEVALRVKWGEVHQKAVEASRQNPGVTLLD